MALPTSSAKTVTLHVTTTENFPNYLDMASRPLVTLRELARFFEAAASGQQLGTYDVQVSSSAGAKASGAVTISSGTGSITATINGVGISVTWATSDTATATALAAAINASANALVSGIVTASSAAGVVTVTAVSKGKDGNSITLAASGTGATASGARLTGGAGADVAINTVTF